MYAVVFDLDTDCLTERYEGMTYSGVCKVIQGFMNRNGFTHIQGNVCFGDASVDAVHCVLTIQKLVKQYPWFVTCVRELRMLRIEENNDLLHMINDLA